MGNISTVKPIIAVVGLGYVGLPLAVAFAKAGFTVIGFDIDKERVGELKGGKDRTGEIDARDLKQKTLVYTTDASLLKKAGFVIIAVPTPVHENKKPDLRPVQSASEITGKNMRRGAIVIYESTVWPGLTEEYCVPILEKKSGMQCGKDFFIAYSPERINPGDTKHTLQTIVKVVAGMNNPVRKKVAKLYRKICRAGVFEAASIRAAEAAKVIENTQRDLNIALMNELAMLFRRLGIPMRDVLNAAFTKWNFGRYAPGLVGGHCIPVDPYYLTTLAKKVGYRPKVILAGRAINDAMPDYVVSLLEEGLREAKKLKAKSPDVRSGSRLPHGKNMERRDYKLRILVLGLTFKENVPDTRNSPAKYLIRSLKQKGYLVDTYDPHVTPAALAHEKFGGTFLKKIPVKAMYDGIIVTVAHREFIGLSGASIKKLFRKGRGAIIDVRGIFANTRLPKEVIYRTL